MKKITILSILVLCGITLFATTFLDIERVCAVCGGKSKQTVVASTNSMGSADLDLRPPEMMRSTMPHWVEKCPACGYCAGDISELSKNAKVTVLEASYKAQLSDPAFPELANKFLCKMMIQDRAEEEKGAIYSAICASWACDDANEVRAATAAREMVIGRLVEFRKKGKSYVAQKGGDEILLSDILRRNGQFEEAAQIADKGISLDPEEVIKVILKFQLELIGKKDKGVHKISEALKK